MAMIGGTEKRRRKIPTSIIGIDLAGPGNAADTAMACFRVDGGRLTFLASRCDGSDKEIHSVVQQLSKSSRVVIGLDAPLSYEAGGGDRARDKAIRRVIGERGMHPGSIMAPTAYRMVYLTLRGVMLSRILEGLQDKYPVEIIEAHPLAAMGLRGAPLSALKTYKKSTVGRTELLRWFSAMGMKGIRPPKECSSHFVDACGAALAAWQWHIDEPAWIEKADGPFHPYDFAC